MSSRERGALAILACALSLTTALAHQSVDDPWTRYRHEIGRAHV